MRIFVIVKSGAISQSGLNWKKNGKHSVPSFTCPSKGVKLAPGHCLLAQASLVKHSTVLIKCNKRKYQQIVVGFCVVNFGKQRAICAQEGWQRKCSTPCATDHCGNWLPGSACKYPDGLSHTVAFGKPGLPIFIIDYDFSLTEVFNCKLHKFLISSWIWDVILTLIFKKQQNIKNLLTSIKWPYTWSI